MPHLLLERFREFHQLLEVNCCPCLKTGFPIHDLVVGTTDLVANALFLFGSICFLPSFAAELDVFIGGCIMFVLGATLYLITCTFCLVESYMFYQGLCFEVFENGLYIIGAWLFFVGTILYWPKSSQYSAITSMQGLTPAQFFNLFTPEFEGTVLFAVGSGIFGFAAFTNALNHRKYQGEQAKLMTTITTISMAADMLFVAGSMAFLPNLGCSEKMTEIGAWLFIIGSALFVFASFLDILRTMRLWKFTQLGKAEGCHSA